MNVRGAPGVPFFLMSDRVSEGDVSAARLYGRGVFTTVGVYGGELFLWEKHWRRLRDDAGRLGLDLSSYSEDSVRADALSALQRDGIADGRVRITFYDERAGAMWSGAAEGGVSMSILTGPPRRPPAPFSVGLSPYRLNTASPLAGVKSCNYLEHLLAHEEARGRGFTEAVRLNERGEVASASLANVFWLRDRTLFTPSLGTGCLPGTTREFIIENIACREVEAPWEELADADAVYLTSAGIGVVAVDELNGRRLDHPDHQILTIIPHAGR